MCRPAGVLAASDGEAAPLSPGGAVGGVPLGLLAPVPTEISRLRTIFEQMGVAMYQ